MDTGHLIKTIETIMDQNYFWLNNKIYKQEDRIPMNEAPHKFFRNIFTGFRKQAFW